MNKEEVIKAYTKNAIGTLTLIDLCKMNQWELTIKPNGEVIIDDE